MEVLELVRDPKLVMSLAWMVLVVEDDASFCSSLFLAVFSSRVSSYEKNRNFLKSATQNK